MKSVKWVKQVKRVKLVNNVGDLGKWEASGSFTGVLLRFHQGFTSCHPTLGK